MALTPQIVTDDVNVSVLVLAYVSITAILNTFTEPLVSGIKAKNGVVFL